MATWWRQLYKMGKALVGLEGPLQVVAHVKADPSLGPSLGPRLGPSLGPRLGQAKG